MAIDPSVPAVAAGLIGGYSVARYTGRRELGGVALATAGVVAGRSWLPRGAAVTTGLTAAYLGAFGVSHPLAKKIGAWPSVLTVTAAATALTAVVTARS
ncbi:hypothetical protein GOHSU_25_00100 [Gordonia hirsuta DSM 44140 = NBRC 16056]|uniref:Uncharacterized protein n=1 Tax=Gordonia hirsuta DSM 44140 = NBRC 16056 TaxID=1121927 RepID=L7L9F2_9ACTN|nr:hypothetical protein [Gordonia hirsuta]GAC57775.1 hypothetical protein GOHSU_25_00100 [Gordonia hirsuta DSM 44140 = NBRC 16056]